MAVYCILQLMRFHKEEGASIRTSREESGGEGSIDSLFGSFIVCFVSRLYIQGVD